VFRLFGQVLLLLFKEFPPLVSENSIITSVSARGQVQGSLMTLQQLIELLLGNGKPRLPFVD